MLQGACLAMVASIAIILTGFIITKRLDKLIEIDLSYLSYRNITLHEFSYIVWGVVITACSGNLLLSLACCAVGAVIITVYNMYLGVRYNDYKLLTLIGHGTIYLAWGGVLFGTIQGIM